MCAAMCTVNLAGAQSSSGSVPVGGGVKEERRSPAQWIRGREEASGSEGGKLRGRLRDAVLHAEECTPTKRIGGLSGDGKQTTCSKT